MTLNGETYVSQVDDRYYDEEWKAGGGGGGSGDAIDGVVWVLWWAWMVLGHIVSSIMIGGILMVSLIRIYVAPYFLDPKAGVEYFWEWLTDTTHTVKLRSVGEYAQSAGYVYEVHEVKTDDGYILLLEHIYKPSQLATTHNNTQHSSSDTTHNFAATQSTASTTNTNPTSHTTTNTSTTTTHTTQHTTPHTSRYPPVVLCHGLMQCSGVFVLNGADSLAFVLADKGLDVWLANNRGSSPLRHETLSCWSKNFWNWSFQEVMDYDFPAFVRYVCKATGQPTVSWVGHSQGNAQAFGSLALHPELQSKINLLIALAPAACLRLNITPVLKLMFKLPTTLFYALFGKLAFLPVQAITQMYFHPKVFAIIAFGIFADLFSWGDGQWARGMKAKYFQYTPRPVSSKGIRHWGRMLEQGQLVYYTKCEETGERLVKPVDLNAVRCPIALFYGEKDLLVDGARLRSILDPSVVRYVDNVENYEHMDTLWATNASRRVYPQVVELLQGRTPPRSSTVPYELL
eukprot:TRINITY_DN7775_c0_g1_i1.p1 TRINITY_DN7775_c0_g1~~TRINITY_DN7775_c0_g1_i1.p1  ORF type:complete len:514 (+),score=74.52 TRINITY_DN7775_c0_g1_i1:243-1784(+)